MDVIKKQCGRFEREDYQAEIKFLIEDACSRYDYAYKRVNELNELQQDLLHIIENEKMDSLRRSKWFKAMRDCRLERRECSVTVTYLKKFVDFVRTPVNQGQINNLLDNKMLAYFDGVYNAKHLTSEMLFGEDKAEE